MLLTRVSDNGRLHKSEAISWYCELLRGWVSWSATILIVAVFCRCVRLLRVTITVGWLYALIHFLVGSLQSKTWLVWGFPLIIGTDGVTLMRMSLWILQFDIFELLKLHLVTIIAEKFGLGHRCIRLCRYMWVLTNQIWLTDAWTTRPQFLDRLLLVRAQLLEHLLMVTFWALTLGLGVYLTQLGWFGDCRCARLMLFVWPAYARLSIVFALGLGVQLRVQHVS